MNRRLGITLNLMVVGVLGTLLLAILLVLHGGIAVLTSATGQQRVAQEAEVAQRQFDKTQHELLASAKLFAATPRLVDAVISRDPARIRTAALVTQARFGFDSVGITDSEGQRILADAKATAYQIAQEDAILARALVEIDTPGMISGPGWQRSMLAVGVPIYDDTSQLIGGVIVNRAVDTAFLDALNLSRQGNDLFLIKDGRVLAQSTPSSERLADVSETVAPLLDAAALDRALAGQTTVAQTLVTISNAPYALAHAPLNIGGQPAGVVGVVVDVSQLVAFQNQLTTNFAIVFSLLSLAAVGLMTVFVHRRVTRPLHSLQTAAERMAQGDYHTRAAATRQDEIGQLARAFNSTTQAVQERESSMQQLAHSLEQRSEELEQTLANLRQSLLEQDQLHETIRELASPVLPVLKDTLVMPLIGVIDADRAALLTQSLLAAIERHRAATVILDVTGVPLVDTQVAGALLQVASAARLLGTQTILVGMRPELAQTIVGLGLQLSDLITRADLQSGIAYAMQRRQPAVGRGI